MLRVMANTGQTVVCCQLSHAKDSLPCLALVATRNLILPEYYIVTDYIHGLFYVDFMFII